MTVTNRHAAAADHHSEAAKVHREAFDQFQVGKDPQHSARQALAAHACTLQALKSDNKAHKNHPTAHTGNSVPNDPEDGSGFPAESVVTGGNMRTNLKGAQNHAVAADHHTEAARCHLRAVDHCAAGKYKRAAHEAETAHKHTQKSLFHSYEAAKPYLDRNAELDAAGQDMLNWIQAEIFA
jgi:hypothetical protein